jgi:hypothetical protein
MKMLVIALAATLLAGGNSRARQDADSLLAPIALYPDALLAQVLLCSGDPARVTKLHGWLEANPSIKGSALQDAATVAGFEPSFVALALFPQVVAMMAERLDWTTRLGKAFASDRTAVFESIQRLRAEAMEAGTLKSTPQQEVETRTIDGGQQVIVIEPANPQVVYVPQYDPQVVYVQAPQTVVVQDDTAGEAAAAGVIGFAAGIAIGAAIDNDYYYGPYGWRGGFYMYDDAWDDWYDAREDAREDWMDHREDLIEERGERTREGQEQRTERAQERQSERTERVEAGQGQRTERAQTRQQTGGDAFAGYASGKSERAASSRGQRSRSSSSRRGGRRQ